MLELQARLKVDEDMKKASAASRMLEQTMGAAELREAAAAAARANPLPPKPVAKAAVGQVCGAGTPCDARPAEPSTASLSKSGYWFEDTGDTIKVCVPLEKYLNGQPLPADCATAKFSDLRCTLEVLLDHTTYILETGELAYMVDASKSTCKVRPKTKRVVLEMPKLDKEKTWGKLTAM